METKALRRRKVYGGIQRFIHAWIGLTVLALIILGWTGKFIDPGATRTAWIQAHIVLGYSLTVGLVLRVVWGLVGPAEARLSKLWPGRKTAEWGHEPLASFSYLVLYLMLVIAVGTGFMLAAMQYDLGPFASAFFDDLSLHKVAYDWHEWILYLSSAFVMAHMGALIIHEGARGYPLVQAMLSGYQYRHAKEEKPDHE